MHRNCGDVVTRSGRSVAVTLMAHQIPNLYTRLHSMTGLCRILCDFIPHPEKWLLVLQSNTCIHFSKDHCSQKEDYFHLRLYIFGCTSLVSNPPPPFECKHGKPESSSETSAQNRASMTGIKGGAGVDCKAG